MTRWTHVTRKTHVSIDFMKERSLHTQGHLLYTTYFLVCLILLIREKRFCLKPRTLLITWYLVMFKINEPPYFHAVAFAMLIVYVFILYWLRDRIIVIVMSRGTCPFWYIMFAYHPLAKLIMKNKRVKRWYEAMSLCSSRKLVSLILQKLDLS